MPARPSAEWLEILTIRPKRIAFIVYASLWISSIVAATFRSIKRAHQAGVRQADQRRRMQL
jgi:hypothetical protein